MYKLIVLIILAASSQVQAQQAVKPKLNWFTFADTAHSPTKATVYSAVLPGLGQAYNHKYWKIPVVYAALGTGAYFMFDQRAQMRAINADFTARFADANPANDPTSKELALRNSYRRNRDIFILATTAIYALQIVDATVDAHFYKLDINQNLNVKLNANHQFFNLAYHF